MGNKMFDLNEPPHENQGGCLHYILLQKDSRTICRTKVSNLPIEVPSVWSISRFKPIQVNQLSVFPKFSLLPDPEDDHQNYEWGRFMHYLSERQKVGVVRFGHHIFNILAPQSHERPNFSHAVIIYETEQRHPGDCEQMAGISERRGNMAVMDTLKRSCRNEFQYGPRNPTPYLREEICDSGPRSKEINTWHKHHDPRIVELNKSIPETSPRESVEDGPGISDPILKKRSAAIRQNFASTDPSYLQTLSQAHAGWIFGAIAELVDNSRDAGASRLKISIESMFSKKEGRKIPVLSVIDDGHGMTHVEMMRMISFGHKRPTEHIKDHIGKFGIGFKTGAMKLGRDVVVLTQTSCSRSVAFLSQSFNENKDHLEIPIVTYCKEGQYMEVDLNVQSEATAEYNLNAIREFSPFNEYFIGEKLGLFGEEGNGTQIYIWNLDRWGKHYSLDWNSGKSSENSVHHDRGDILIHSRRVRSRPGQRSQQVPLDYSLQSYLEVMFLNPRMKIFVQGSLVKTCPLAKTLNKTSVISGEIMGKTIQLTLGRSKLEWDRMNCGIFLYWHGRLIEAYKRVGGQKHNADIGRGVIGVADITHLIDDGDGNSWVLNNKQGFEDCEIYAKLEEWLDRKVDEYWDKNFDNLNLRKGDERFKPDHEWVQCNSCRKWRMLNAGFDTMSLPDEWFCYMPPFNGKCETPEQQMGRGVIIIGEKRSGYHECNRAAQQEETAKVNRTQMRSSDEGQRFARAEEAAKNVKDNPACVDKKSSYCSPSMHKNNSDDDLEGESSQTELNMPRPILKRIRRGPPRSCRQDGK